MCSDLTSGFTIWHWVQWVLLDIAFASFIVRDSFFSVKLKVGSFKQKEVFVSISVIIYVKKGLRLTRKLWEESVRALLVTHKSKNNSNELLQVTFCSIQTGNRSLKVKLSSTQKGTKCTIKRWIVKYEVKRSFYLPLFRDDLQTITSGCRDFGSGTFLTLVLKYEFLC